MTILTRESEKSHEGVWVSESWPMREGNERSSYAVLERSMKGVGYVYFIGSHNGELVKIGFSGKDDSWARLQTHTDGDAFGQGGNYEVLAVVRATRHAEATLKGHWKPYLVAKREVFAAAPLVPYITWLRDNYFVSITEAEFHSPAGQTIIDPQAWLPADGRVSSRRSQTSLFQSISPWAFLPSRVTTGDDYYTPPHIAACVRDALGGTIDLDPASHVMANQVIGARRFFTRDDNGLIQPWSGRVYLNPPFSSWPDWVGKVLQEADAVESIVLLGATRTLTAQYFEPLLRRVDAFCIITGRTPFWGIATDSDSPTDGHFLLYIGGHVQRFVMAVQSLGAAWVTPPGLVKAETLPLEVA